MIIVSHKPLETLQLSQQLAPSLSTGAVASFTGYMRDTNSGRRVSGMYLDHYSGMAEAQLEAIVNEAKQRWPILACLLAHRVGAVAPGEMLVYVETHSSHRQAAFDACNFIMDTLKTSAPFWKKEHTETGDFWVDSRRSDTQALTKWHN